LYLKEDTYVSDVIATINKELEQYRTKGYNVVGVTTIYEKPEFMTPVVKVVQISPDTNAGEVYPLQGGKYGLSSLAYNKFRLAGRIEFEEVQGGAIIVRKGPDGYEVTARAIGKRPDLEGTYKREYDEKTINFTAREERVRATYTAKAKKEHTGWNDDRVRQYVEHMVQDYMRGLKTFANEIALSGAQARVITKLLGLKKHYTKEELSRPFVIVSVIPEIDMKDPEIKRMVTGHLMGIKPELFPTATGVAQIPQYVSYERPLLIATDTHPPASSLEDFESLPRVLQEKEVRSLIGDGRLHISPEAVGSMSTRELVSAYREAACASR
jgi:hypothetical protein